MMVKVQKDLCTLQSSFGNTIGYLVYLQVVFRYLILSGKQAFLGFSN